MKTIIVLILSISLIYLVVSQTKNKLNANSNIKGNTEMINTEIATFAAGCFWGVELKFSKLNGVISSRVGYMGGSMENPTYEDVCYNQTGHAEVCQVVYNPELISYQQLVESFFKFHDPTQLNRQGPDVGDQYRSAIFTHNEKQVIISNEIIAQLNKNKFNGKIVTKLEKAGHFWDAEEYHQKYLEKRGINSCSY